MKEGIFFCVNSSDSFKIVRISALWLSRQHGELSCLCLTLQELPSAADAGGGAGPGAAQPLLWPGEHQHPSSTGRREEEVPRVLQVGDRAVPSEGRPRGGPPPEGQRPQPELQTPWWEPDSLLRNHLGHSNYILYGQITLTVKWQLLSNLKIYIFSYSFFPARLQGTGLATSLLQAQHSTAALAPSSSSTKALPNLHV